MNSQKLQSEISDFIFDNAMLRLAQHPRLIVGHKKMKPKINGRNT